MEEDKTSEASQGEVQPKGNEIEEAWKAHVGFAEKFLGSNAEYCRRNGLSAITFRDYKKKYGTPKTRVPRQKAFLKVEREMPAQESAPRAVRAREAELPDARWTAEFIAALMAALR